MPTGESNAIAEAAKAQVSATLAAARMQAAATLANGILVNMPSATTAEGIELFLGFVGALEEFHGNEA